MPVRVNEFVIQARFEEDETEKQSPPEISQDDLMVLKGDIIAECMEKVEALLSKREGR